jgi:RNA polymerase sigma-70 factor, ECF subfamily
MSISAQHSDPPELADGELVERAQGGDDLALEVLFERYSTRITVYLIRMVGNDGVGYELAQETFLKAWEALPHLRDSSSFVSWLYRIATNLAHNHLRRERLIQWLPWKSYEESESAREPSLAGPEKQVEEGELLKLALSQVPLKYRACVILQIVEELPQRRIAELLAIKENSVSTYVSRGLKELRQAYARLTIEQDILKEER